MRVMRAGRSAGSVSSSWSTSGRSSSDRDEDGRVDLAGADVILAHRLLKNTVIEFRRAERRTVSSLPHASPALPMRSSFPFTPSSYDSFGEVTGLVQDLATVAGRRRDAQRVRVSSEDADLEVIRVLDAPPSVVWQYYVQPQRRAEWSIEVNETLVHLHPQTRRAASVSGHRADCAHAVGGDALREYLDWRPL